MSEDAQVVGKSVTDEQVARGEEEKVQTVGKQRSRRASKHYRLSDHTHEDAVQSFLSANEYEAKREELMKTVVHDSVIQGAKAFVATGIVSSGAVYMAVQRLPKFASSLGISARVACAFMPALFAFSFVSETATSRRAHPEAFLPHEETVQTPQHTPISLASKGYFSNISPLKGLTLASIPVVGGIYYLNSHKSHLTLSQRVMHTRVLGQASVLALLGSYAVYDQACKFRSRQEEKKLAPYTLPY